MSLFTVPDGFNLVGCDASGLELRCLAHYLGAFDGEFCEAITRWGYSYLQPRTDWLTVRDLAKRSYMVHLWYRKSRLGEVVGKSAQEGKRIKEKLFKALPALKQLADTVLVKVRNQNYLLGLDKRKLIPRSEHSSLNLLIQSCGALILKKATVILHEKLKEYKYDNDVQMVAHIHDELQLQCKSAIADAVGKIARQSIIDAGVYFKLRCPLDAQYKIGKTWADTH